MKKKKSPRAYPVKGRPNLFRAYGIDQTTQARKAFFANTREEAESKARKSYQTLPEEGLAEYYFFTYLPTIEMRSENWLNQVAWAMDKYCLPAMGNFRLDEIKRQALQSFFNRLSRKLSPSTLRKVKIVLSGVLNLAVADEKIPSNPCRFVRLPQAEEPDKVALSYQELAKLYIEARPEVKVFVLVCGLGSGVRVGEACGLTRIHLSHEGILHIRQQVLQLKGGATISKTLKTPQTKRDIPLPEELAGEIRRLSNDNAFLISATNGRHYLPNNLTRELASACIKARIPVISPHELRHTFISLLENELEAPTAIVASLAGKKDIRVTAGYSHTHKEQLKRWLQRHWERFQDALEKEVCSKTSGTQ